MESKSPTLLYVVDLAGTLLFAVEGASAAMTGNLDLMGLLVLAFATALGGGIVRDLLIGYVPPSALRDWRYPVTAFLGAGIIFFFNRFVQGVPSQLMITLDAVGLALFAIAGTEKALLHDMPPLVAILLGGITGVGGGTIRDVLLARIPTVLRADVYATAALGGAAIMVICRKMRVPAVASAFIGGSACFLLRVISVWRHWNLPRVT